jgi:hypothetical protein
MSRLLWGLSVAAALAFPSCASRSLIDANGVDLIGADRVYTLVNLHPDEKRSVLYAVNYQQAGLIPLYSEVVLLHLGREELRFRVLKTGREYQYVYHDAAAEPFPAHLLRFFGTNFDATEIQQLSDRDQAGIAGGVALLGMSKRGVTLAIGYPPRHMTPDLDSNVWMYWKSRLNRFSVMFDAKGNVVAVVD